jgi:STE24 endopeptidase
MDASKRSGHGNAYFTGLGKNKRVVFFDTLLKSLSTNETLAVLAHELGHLKHKHILKSLVMSLIFSFLGLALMGYLSNKEWFYQGHFNKFGSAGSLFLIFSSAIGVYTFWFTPIQSFFSRRNEFQADAYAASERPASDMISALLKLYKDNSSTLTPDKLYAGFYYSHPHASERIKALKKL